MININKPLRTVGKKYPVEITKELMFHEDSQYRYRGNILTNSVHPTIPDMFGVHWTIEGKFYHDSTQQHEWDIENYD